MSDLSVADVLERAADLIEPEGAWGREHMAVDKDGYIIAARSEDAACFCAMGAIRHVAHPNTELEDDALNALRRAIPRKLCGAIPKWNDAPNRTQSEVVLKLREAAALARAKGPSND